jgi:hypothetical protein
MRIAGVPLQLNKPKNGRPLSSLAAAKIPTKMLFCGDIYFQQH